MLLACRRRRRRLVDESLAPSLQLLVLICLLLLLLMCLLSENLHASDTSADLLSRRLLPRSMLRCPAAPSFALVVALSCHSPTAADVQPALH